jgi:hypothetical protein
VIEDKTFAELPYGWRKAMAKVKDTPKYYWQSIWEDNHVTIVAFLANSDRWYTDKGRLAKIGSYVFL